MARKERIRAILEQQRLWTAVVPGYDGQAEISPKEREKMADALNVLKQSTDDDTLHFIKKCTSPKDAWETLEKIYCEYTAIDVVEVLEQVCLLRKTSDISMIKYIVKSEELMEILEESGVRFDNKLRAAMLLKGLPMDQFKDMIAQFRVNEDTFTLEAVKGKLLKEGRKEKIEQRQESDSEKVAALVVKKVSGKPVKGSGISCYTCGESNHIAKFCEKVHEATLGQKTVKYFMDIVKLCTVIPNLFTNTEKKTRKSGKSFRIASFRFHHP